MTAPVQPTPIALLPVGPRPTDTVEQFDAKSFATIEAQEAMIPEINAAIATAYQNAVAAHEAALASGASQDQAAASALTAFNEANRSQIEATRSEAGAASAWAAAAAAGAAAGLPSMVGKAGMTLTVNAAGNGVEWKAAGFEVGGIYVGTKKPTLGVWLDTDAVYLQSSYPVLFAALGLVPGVAPWTQRTPAALTGARGLAYGNGMYVAVGTNASSGAVGASSPDGISWTARAISAVEAITFGNGLFVSLGAGGNAVTSPDGITWTARTMPAGGWKSVAYGNGLFVAVGSGSNAVTSPDGITWTLRSSVPNGLISIAYGGGRFCAVGSSGAATSVDGITWTPGAVPASQLLSVTWGGGLFVAVGAGAGNQGVLAMTSVDGSAWTPRAMPAGVAGARYTTVANYSGRFIAAGAASGVETLFADSPDGATWTARQMPPGSYTALLVAAGQIVAAGSVMQTAPMFPYNTATQFYVPAPAGVVGLKSWIKAGD